MQSLLVTPDIKPINREVAFKNACSKLLDNHCYSAILEGYFNGSNWGHGDFVCTTSSLQRALLLNARKSWGISI